MHPSPGGLLEGVVQQIYTSHWRNKDLAHLDCQPVAISRGTPRWRVPYRWKKLMKLAPSRETFVLTGREEFEQSYLEQLAVLDTEEIITDLRRIRGECGGKPLIMLC